METNFKALAIVMAIVVIAMASMTVVSVIYSSNENIACFKAAGSNPAAIAACKAGG